MRLDVDETENDDLASMTQVDLDYMGWDIATLRGELHRVERVIGDNVMTGADLTHWFERESILKGMCIVIERDGTLTHHLENGVTHWGQVR